jgi:hypothetical protein
LYHFITRQIVKRAFADLSSGRYQHHLQRFHPQTKLTIAGSPETMSTYQSIKDLLCNKKLKFYHLKYLMIKYQKNPENNIVEICIDGKITETDFDRVITQLKADLQKHGKLRILEEIRSFEGIDPIALWKDLNFGLSHINDITHAAVVADAKWMRTFAEALDNVLSAKVKAFESTQIDEAKIWLASS